jgi:predicted nucleic acid-binding protein
MTVVVSDTSPINYLVLIDAIFVLPELFTSVVIPKAVSEELQHDQTPEPCERMDAQSPRLGADRGSNGGG